MASRSSCRAYKGKVVLFVNVASRCGLTPQYEALEAIYKKYQDQGFVVLGFPANEFGHQEPGTNEEIVKFCQSKYSVDFPMFAKIVVKGEGISPLYDYLTSAETDPKFAGPISWNFEKFLVGRDGQVVEPIQSQDQAGFAGSDCKRSKPNWPRSKRPIASAENSPLRPHDGIAWRRRGSRLRCAALTVRA